MSGYILTAFAGVRIRRVLSYESRLYEVFFTEQICQLSSCCCCARTSRRISDDQEDYRYPDLIMDPVNRDRRKHAHAHYCFHLCECCAARRSSALPVVKQTGYRQGKSCGAHVVEEEQPRLVPTATKWQQFLSRHGWQAKNETNGTAYLPGNDHAPQASGQKVSISFWDANCFLALPCRQLT